jgi:hypothetical protein
VDDTSLKQFEKTVGDMAGKADAPGSETISPQADGSPVRGLGDEIGRTKAKADALGGTNMKPPVDAKPVEKLGQEVGRTKGKAESLAAAFLKANLIMKAASGAMGAAIGFVRDAVIGTTAETERYRVAIGTMMHDQEKANKLIHDLDYGEGVFDGSRISDFYGTANAIGGLQNLISFGMEAEKAGDILTRIGDVALGDTETFSSLSNLIGKVFSKGKAEAIELKQFMLKGIDVAGETAAIDCQRSSASIYRRLTDNPLRSRRRERQWKRPELPTNKQRQLCEP